MRFMLGGSLAKISIPKLAKVYIVMYTLGQGWKINSLQSLRIQWQPKPDQHRSKPLSGSHRIALNSFSMTWK